jgi:uncharacterized protein (DUF362 family)
MSEKSLVIISKGLGPYRNAMRVLESLDIPDLQGKRVLLKPNAGRFVAPGTGVITDPRVVAAAADYFKPRCKEVVIGDSPILGVKPLSNLEIGGYAQVAKERGITAVNVDGVPPLRLAIPDGKAVKKLRVCRIWQEVDYVVSIPVIKTHMHTQVSLALKNMKGLLYKKEKVRLHQLPVKGRSSREIKMLDIAIADLGTVLGPHLSLIDGTVGQEGLGPSAGSPKRLGLVLGSSDFLAADAVACRLMGFDPEGVHHLRLCAERLGRTLKSKDIEVRPKNFRSMAVKFKAPPKKLSLSFPGMKLQDCDSCSACLSTIFAFLQRYSKELDYMTQAGELKLSTGSGVKDTGPDTFLIGNCAIQAVQRGFAVKGCPPVASQIFEVIKKQRG